MVTIKAFTDVQQSKKLAGILPLESADMYYEWPNKKVHFKDANYNGMGFSCWSLAALLDVLPNNEHIATTLSRGGWKIEPVEYIDEWFCEYEDDVYDKNFAVSADNPVDACYELVLKLHKLKML